jgi:hypothetical protein
MLALSQRVLPGECNLSQQEVAERAVSTWLRHEQPLSIHQTFLERYRDEAAILSIGPGDAVSVINDASMRASD